ncbi:MAG: AraC family transcriptional regulator [Hyphomicrobiales bacterium]|nr:AraC family transcriptional regulator [Hyphomicrobiales bacterium]
MPAFARLEDWTRSLAARAFVRIGSSRQSQRRIKGWTGLSLRELRRYARVESLSRAGKKKLAQTALDAGYADQSHMGREVRSVTGETPARIARLIETDERYWVYRLFAARR